MPASSFPVFRITSPSAAIAGEDDHVVTVAPALERVGDFGAFPGEGFDEATTYAALRKAETVGRPVGSAEWLQAMGGAHRQTAHPGQKGKETAKWVNMHLSP